MYYCHDRTFGWRWSFHIPDHNSGNASSVQALKHASDNIASDLCYSNGCYEPAAMGRPDNAFRNCTRNRSERAVETAAPDAGGWSCNCTCNSSFLGIRREKRGAGAETAPQGIVKAEEYDALEEKTEDAAENDLARPKLFAFNAILTLAVIVCLVFVKVPSYYIFMVGCVIALLVNYPGAKLQNKIIKSHSGPALMMASTILAAGVFLGVLEETEIMNHMANVLATFIPQSMGRFLPLIIGVLSVPLTLLFCTDSYFFGLLPVLISIGNQFGVNPAHTAIAMVVCRNCATFISPVVPATFLGVGLAGVEIKDHIKASFFWIWGVSIVCLISGILLGVIHF